MNRKRPGLGTILAVAWISILALVGIFAPVLASGHALVLREFDPSTSTRTTTYAISSHLRPMDIALAIALILAVVGALLPARATLRRSLRVLAIIAASLLTGALIESATPSALFVFPAEHHTSSPTFHATFAPIPFSPDERIAGARFVPPGAETPDGRTFILGSDSRGQDVLAQLIHGCRTALLVSTGSALIAMTIGITLGALMGWFRSWVDVGLMRLVEGAMSIPVLLILVVAAGVLPRELGITILVIGLITWTDAARLTRAEFLRLREQDFVAAARATGASPARIIALHLLPSALPPLLVEGSFALAAAILYEASLSFLGLGPTEGASWGRLLAQGLDPAGRPLWWITVPAGTMIFLTVLSLHALGDILRRRLAHTDH